MLVTYRRSGRVVEGDSLENCRAKLRGFESLLLLHSSTVFPDPASRGAL